MISDGIARGTQPCSHAATRERGGVGAAGSVAMADELLAGVGGETAILGVAELREAIKTTLDKLGPRERVLIIPPVRAADSSTPSPPTPPPPLLSEATDGLRRSIHLILAHAPPHRLVPTQPAQRCWLLFVGYWKRPLYAHSPADHAPGQLGRASGGLGTRGRCIRLPSAIWHLFKPKMKPLLALPTTKSL